MKTQRLALALIALNIAFFAFTVWAQNGAPVLRAAGLEPGDQAVA